MALRRRVAADDPAHLRSPRVRRRIARLDELQRQVQLGALGVTVLATALLTLTYGFLENVGAPHINVIWVWPVMGAIWGISSCIAGRYYS